ncbi:glycosyltransferase [Endozoicomonas sp. ONNA2]|uniref:glycosyltransferase n=1 Tax=Endozoicomonas sp. ONNA2 TaxID=2828741 RepID=UPI0021490AAB|nr:glycosyltransferase [Endozoicomonas sp. ONNA2]
MPSKKQRSTDSSVFGCLVASTESAYFNGLRRANDEFLKAIIRYSRFQEIHIFSPQSLLPEFKSGWETFLQHYGSDKAIQFLPAHELNRYFSRVRYQVFHQGDPWIGNLAALRDAYCLEPFPVTGRAHTLSTDSNMSNTRDLLLSPLKSCDAILCSSEAQKKVMMRLLSAASSRISDHIGVAIPYKGSVLKLPLGIEPDECYAGAKEEARGLLGIEQTSFVILTLGRIAPSDKMDLQPVLLVMNDLVEQYGHRNIKWIVAGAGDAGSPTVQSLLKQAYALNLEGCIRFELEIEDDRKHQWLSACDMVLTLADNIQESFGIVPLEAMVNGKAVVLSDWNGYSELLEDGISGCLIETVSTDLDDLARPVGSLLTNHAHFLQAQGTAVNLSQCAEKIHQLIQDPGLLLSMGERGRQRVFDHYRWETIVEEYHQLVNGLNKDTDQISRLNKRPVGLPYHQIFEHYPANQLVDDQYLKTTDRGVRLLQRTEQYVHYAEMDSFLAAELIDQVSRLCLSGCHLTELKKRFPEEPALLLNIMWMCKYQVLALTDEPLRKSANNQKRWWPEQQRLPAEVMLHLDCAEPHRFKLIEPLLRWLDLQLACYHNRPENPGFRASLLKPFAAKLDGQLLQAIAWVADIKGAKQYTDVLDYVIEQGGMLYLSAEFPLWYRLNRLWVIHTLKDFKQLFVRFYQDIGEINQLFSDSWQKPAQSIASLDYPLTASSDMIAIILCDNGEKLVYKNRDLAVERQIIGHTADNSNIAGKLNQWLGGRPGLATIRILPGSCDGDYGYCEFITKDLDEALDDRQINDYYQRLGVIAGISILLGLGDVHNRNVVSRNAIPYLVDVKAAFCPSVIKAFESEFNDPQRAFSGADNSFMLTSAWSVFEQFHFSGYRDCLYQLVDGELVEMPSVEDSLVTNNLVRTGESDSLSNIKPFLCSQYASAFEQGLDATFRVVVDHHNDWCVLLNACKGMSVCHLPRLDQQFYWQQKVNLWTFQGFQGFSAKRLRYYFDRVMSRLCQGAEEIQRWCEPEWFEPVTQLSDEFVKNLLSGSMTVLRREIGANGLFSESCISGGVISHHYFSVDTLSKSVRLVQDMAEDPQKMNRFLTFLTAIVKQWLIEEVLPGKNFPEALRDKLPE